MRSSRHANFDDFGTALLTLFRMSTGEGWNEIMDDCINPNKNNAPLSILYFVTFVMIATFVVSEVACLSIFLLKFTTRDDKDSF